MVFKAFYRCMFVNSVKTFTSQLGAAYHTRQQ